MRRLEVTKLFGTPPPTFEYANATARLVYNSAQFSMTVYGAETTEQAAPLVIALGIVALMFSGIEMLIDVLVPPQRQFGRNVPADDVERQESEESGPGGFELRTLGTEEGRVKRRRWEVLCVEEARMGCVV